MRPPAESIANLSLIVGVIALLIFIGVETALLYAVFRYRESRVGEPATFERHRGLEITWTAIPAIVLAVVFILMVGTLYQIGGAIEPQLRVTAIGHQWWWEYRYGATVTANEMHVPVDTGIELELRSADVIHSWWVPELGGKIDMVPGRTNQLRFIARRPGVFEGQCAEFCGVEHAWMRIRVVVESRTDFDRWLANETAAATQAGPGLLVFQANTCVNCHAIRGTSAAATVGPDLTHVGARATLAAGTLPNDLARMRAWLADPQRYKPGAFMPRVPLASSDLDSLASYLVSLK